MSSVLNKDTNYVSQSTEYIPPLLLSLSSMPSLMNMSSTTSLASFGQSWSSCLPDESTSGLPTTEAAEANVSDNSLNNHCV